MPTYGSGEYEERRARHPLMQHHERPVHSTGDQSNGPALQTANPGPLLGDARLHGRGNSSSQAAFLHSMQQSYGNRAVQRFLQRRTIQRGPDVKDDNENVRLKNRAARLLAQELRATKARIANQASVAGPTSAGSSGMIGGAAKIGGDISIGSAANIGIGPGVAAAINAGVDVANSTGGVVNEIGKQAPGIGTALAGIADDIATGGPVKRAKGAVEEEADSGASHVRSSLRPKIPYIPISRAFNPGSLIETVREAVNNPGGAASNAAGAVKEGVEGAIKDPAGAIEDASNLPGDMRDAAYDTADELAGEAGLGPVPRSTGGARGAIEGGKDTAKEAVAGMPTAATIGGGLNVGALANVGGSANIEGAANISAGANMLGSASIGGALMVGGIARVNGVLTVDTLVTATPLVNPITSTISNARRKVQRVAAGALPGVLPVQRDGGRELTPMYEYGPAQEQETPSILTGDSMRINGPAETGTNISIGGSADIGGAASIGGAGNISGGATINGDTSIGGVVNVGGGLDAGGAFQSTAANISGNTSIGGNASIGGAVMIAGDVTVPGTLTAPIVHTGNLVSTDSSRESNGSSGAGGMLPGFPRLQRQEDRSGGVITGNSLQVEEDTSIGGNIRVGDEMSVGANSSIGGPATIGGNASIGAAAQIGGGAKVGSYTTISAATNIDGSANIAGAVEVGGALNIQGGADIGSNLTVGGAIHATEIRARKVVAPGF